MTKQRQAEIDHLLRDRDALTAFVDEHEMLVRAVHTMPQMFYVVKDDKLLFCNRQLAEFYDLPEGMTAAGTPWSVMMQAMLETHLPDQATLVDDMKAETLRQIREKGKFNISWALEDGKHLLIEAIEGSDGQIIVTYSDISVLKNAQRKAEAAEKAKAAFLANMSHEIRTPMNGVMGMAELLCSTTLDETQSTYASTILKSGEALLTIINDILDFSKIDAGQLKLHPAPFSIAEAIEDVALLISSRVLEKNLELAVRVQPDLPAMFVGDAGRLRQIITNLMGNAAKFTDEGHILADLSGEATEGGYKLTFKIEDTGIGIPSEKCATIFDKFSQVDDSATRKHEGTGLGLAISASLVELMGGEIGVESQPGEGSTFWFSIVLPVHHGEEKAALAPVDLSGARIAVIDDNAVNRKILKEQLASWGFECALYKNAQEGLVALRDAETGKPDLLILDHHMPGMTGADLAMVLRADPTFNDLPIVMLTSVDEAAGGAGFMSLGVNAHLTKPARAARLFETIVRVLHEKPNAENPASEPSEPAARSAPQSAAPEKSEPAQPESSGGLDILVAEDNEVNRLVLTHILKETGLSYKIALNGREALALYAECQPSVILMDISMPEMNGFEAAKAIREAEAESGLHTPIIAITAHALKDDKEKCLAAGMDDYVSKPISAARLKDRLDHWMRVATEAAA
ncbi:response regulator [Marinicaulis aureus]|uniref:histidine kinase n=1 Tax=Hyphococcus aureus TaxID=2666033 RepID=A0ABW1KW22_9PROT